jgi:hypothetical protein
MGGALVAVYFLIPALTAFPLLVAAQDTNPFGAFGDAVKKLEKALDDKKETSPKSEQKAAPVPSKQPDQASQAPEAPTSGKDATLGLLTWLKRGDPGTIGALSVSQQPWVKLSSSNSDGSKEGANLEGYTCAVAENRLGPSSEKGERLDWGPVKWQIVDCAAPIEPGDPWKIPRYRYEFTIMPDLSYQPTPPPKSIFEQQARDANADPHLDVLKKMWDKHVAPYVPKKTVAAISHVTVLRGLSKEDILKRLDEKFANLGNKKIASTDPAKLTDEDIGAGKLILVSYGTSTVEMIKRCQGSHSARYKCHSAVSVSARFLGSDFDTASETVSFYGVKGSGGVGVAVFYKAAIHAWIVREMIVFEEPIKKANEQWKLLLQEATTSLKASEASKF